MATFNSKLVKPKTLPNKQAQGPTAASLERIKTDDPNYTRQLRAILDAQNQQIKDLHGKVFEVINPRLPQPGDAVPGSSDKPIVPPLQLQEVFVQLIPPVLAYPALNWKFTQDLYDPYINVAGTWVQAMFDAFVPALIKAGKRYVIPQDKQALAVRSVVIEAGGTLVFGPNSTLTFLY